MWESWGKFFVFPLAYLAVVTVTEYTVADQSVWRFVLYGGLYLLGCIRGMVD